MPALKNCENCGDYFIESEGIYSSRFRIGLCNHCIDGSVLCKVIKELLPVPDESGLVPCGCGGKAVIIAQGYGFWRRVVCPLCGTMTGYEPAESSTTTWNRSHGYKED